MLAELLLTTSCNSENGFGGVLAADFWVDWGISWLGMSSMLTIGNHLSRLCLCRWCGVLGFSK